VPIIVNPRITVITVRDQSLREALGLASVAYARSIALVGSLATPAMTP
jgi:hypothetical protein